jgi:hypothetical protein
MANDNYPDDIRDFDNHPGSPFYDDSGFESAVAHKFEELKECHVKVAEIICELDDKPYQKIIDAALVSIKDNKLLMAIINTLKDAEPELFHEALTDNKELLSEVCRVLIYEAVYDYAQDSVLKQK